MIPPLKKMPCQALIEKKQDLDPYYCPSNYLPNYKEDAQALIRDLVPESTPEEKEEDKSTEDKPARGQNKEDLGEDASTEEDDYSDLDYFY